MDSTKPWPAIWADISWQSQLIWASCGCTDSTQQGSSKIPVLCILLAALSLWLSLLTGKQNFSIFSRLDSWWDPGDCKTDPGTPSLRLQMWQSLGKQEHKTWPKTPARTVDTGVYGIVAVIWMYEYRSSCLNLEPATQFPLKDNFQKPLNRMAFSEGHFKKYF